MGLRTGVLLVVVLVIAALAALNWTCSTPTAMSVGVMQVTAPLGLVMLGLTALLGVVCLAYVVYLQSSVMLETRRHNKEMQSQRDLADKAEASRFTELRNYLDAQEQAHMARNAELHVACWPGSSSSKPPSGRARSVGQHHRRPTSGNWKIASSASAASAADIRRRLSLPYSGWRGPKPPASWRLPR